MKSMILAAVVATITMPAFSYAQLSQPATRAQVRAQLAQLETAGYNPHVDGDYPHDLQQAEAVVAAKESSVSGYGTDSTGTAQSGQ